MATQVLTLYTPEEALDRGHDVYEVMLVHWGTNEADRYPIVGVPPFSVFGANFPISPAGIAIGPRSTVDRCWLSWNTQLAPPAGGNPAFFNSMYRVITHERPLMFGQPAGQGVVGGLGALNDAMRAGLLYIYPRASDPPPGQNTGVVESTCVPELGYFKADGATFVDWAPTDTPILHLQFYLKPNFSPPAGKRLPYGFRSFTLIAAPEIGEETLIALLPTYGRKDIHIQINTDTAIDNYRIGAIRQVAPSLFTQPIFETTDGQKTPTANSAVTSFHLCNPCADYIALYATPAAATPLTVVRYTVMAYD